MNSTRLPSPTLLSLGLVAAITAAIGAPQPASARRPLEIRPPATCGAARDQLLELAAQQAINRRYGYPWRLDVLRGGVTPTSEGVKGSAGPGHHTTTNVQEQGVDEADTVKSDGKHIYTISGRQILIVDSWPVSEMSIVGRYELPDNVTPAQLLLRGGKLVVLSRVYETAEARRVAPGWYPTGFFATRVSVLDISNRARPRLESSIDLEGWMAQARLVGDDLYLVTNASLHVPDRMARAADWFARRLPAAPDRYDWKAIEKLRAEGLPKVRAYLGRKFRFASLDSAMPRMRTSGPSGQMSGFSPMYRCDAVIAPRGGKPTGILNLAHVDLDRPRVAHNTGVFGNGYQVYASTRALYVAAPVYDTDPIRWGGIAVPRIDDRGRTRIHKFAFGGRDGHPRYAASGTVTGHLLNQFSMSEHRGYLRIATTDQRWWNDQERGGNNLFVLDELYGRLRVVGQITGLARGERIYSARMIGDRGYLVTFRQTDPLFTLDLSDPRAPRVAGELKINGFSSYIHPLGADRLLTIGRDADDDGRVKGVHLQIFDVSDPANPVRTHQQLLPHGGSSWSAASWDHKAFTFDPVTRTLAIPLSTYDYRNPAGNFNGVVVYAVDHGGGFDELGRIRHAASGDAVYRAQINRSMIIDDALITFSGARVEAHDLSDLSAGSLASIAL